MLTLKCALEQIACKHSTHSLLVYMYMGTSNPMPTVASWSMNSCLHSGVPEVASGEHELACGEAGCQSLLKGKLQIT